MRFGIDRTKLKNIVIDQVDIKKLKDKGFIVIQDNLNNYRILKDTNTGEDHRINYIKVSKQQDETLRINELKVGRGVIPGLNILPMVDYEHLDINLPSQISNKGINDQNISNTIDLVRALKLIEAELKELGFGDVDLMNTELKEIEINCNIPIERPFKDYERVIEYLYDLLPKTLKDYKKHKRQGEFTGITVKNTQQEIKMYDKQKQIKDKTGINTKRVIRLEYTFKTEDKIKSVFGGNNLNDIIKDDFERLQEVMREIVLGDLVDRAYKNMDKQIQHSIKNIKRYREIGGGSNAVDEYLKNHQADLLDVEVIMEAMRDISAPNHYARECRRGIKSVEKIEGIKLFGNINKINEILEALNYKPIKMDITPMIKKELRKHY